MNYRIWIDGIVLAFQFLTTIPIRKEIKWDDERAKASVAAYPIIGLVIASLLACQWFVLNSYQIFSPLIAVCWLLTFSLLFSGGLHLDGWADFHDAVFSRRSREQKLEIMKDPRIGTFGVLAVLFLLGWRFVFLLEIIQMKHSLIIYAVFIIPFFVRMLLGWQLLLGEFARKQGMAVALKVAKGKEVRRIYFIWSIICFILILFFTPSLIWLFLAAFLFLFLWLKWVHYQIGGITGDTIGAGAEGGETFLWGILWFLLLLDMV